MLYMGHFLCDEKQDCAEKECVRSANPLVNSAGSFGEFSIDTAPGNAS